MSYSRSNELANYLEQEYYKREFYKNNIKDILYKYINNKYILDSSLICESNRKEHDIKLVKCGNFLQLYFYSKKRYATDKNFEEMKPKIIYEEKSNTTSKEYKPQAIETKNLNRSKLTLQQLVKSNYNLFKTFITLTFEENITDVKEANKKFHIWRRNIKRIKPNFAYVCVPEFQKRGAVHYHLMTNIDYNDIKLLLGNEVKLYKPGSGWQVGKNIKGWVYGYSLAIDITRMNVVGYLTKYFTKDIDERLFGKHRFFYSQNLEKPEIHLLDLSKFQDNSLYQLLQINYDFKEMTYSRKYQDMFGDDVMFIEYKIESEV